MSFLRLSLGLATLLLAGCAGLAQPSLAQREAEAHWTVQRDTLQQIAQFTLQGRVASGGAFGLSGALRWTQNADGSFQLNLSGPFGAGAVAISGTENFVEVRTREGTTTTTDPEAWLLARTGWTFPVAGLRWWALGLPAPHSAARLELNDGGQLLRLQQDGWQLEYLEYQDSNGLILPRKFEATHEQTKIKVVADRWSDLQTAP